MKLGVSGEAGSFSEQAGLRYAEKAGIKPSLIYLTDMEQVLAAIEAGSIDIGLFPVINFRGGLVHMAFDAMGKHLFHMIDEIWLDVHQCLLVKPGKNIQDIKKVASHSQAIAQCQQYLQTYLKTAEIIPWEDTAKAAKDLSTGMLSENTAVIAPIRSAALYHLSVLDENIQDNKPNLTVFIVVEKREK